ncbi:phage portal protein [Streptomyces sp. URMC 129]|uniref:phage portal protein n=1 Tax=Streptomyces sp. URMC 129 TaxID=3423407 RepID=UPI003F1D87B9
MPLPTSDQPWPPTDPVVASSMADWDAWYSGDPDRLAERYANRATKEPRTRPSQYRGGVVGRLSRWWWGEPTPWGEQRAKIHAPLAADIARTSSALLFSEPPRILTDDTAAANRIGKIVEEGLHTALLEGGELSSALGGAFLRLVWDREIQPLPWVSTVPADGAAPEFRHNRLRAVTFWTVLEADDRRVVRHLERHEPGLILNAVYEGTPDSLGRDVGLAAFPQTERLTSAIATGTRRLTASHMPNMRPARAWRNLPGAAGLGQSDYAGIEPILDQLDMAYSSWMRDIRLGRARLVVADSMLDSGGPGQGATFADREVYDTVNALDRGTTPLIEQVQFKIRVEEHRETCRELHDMAVRGAGYSASSFGSDSEGQAVTATEIRARQRRTDTTRGIKIRYATPAVLGIVAAQLELEAGPLFRAPSGSPEGLRIEWQDSITESPREIAETLEMFRRAEAASTETLVRMRNPELEDREVQAEAARILAESGRAVADPTRTGAEFPPPGEDDDEDVAA